MNYNYTLTVIYTSTRPPPIKDTGYIVSGF